MPAVINTPEVAEYEEHGLEEQSKVRVTRSGFWCTMVQYMRRQRAHRSHGTPSSSRVLLHPIEMPVDSWARRYPALYIQALAGQ